MLETFRTVLGTNHKKPKSRIWIEGQRLKAAGFTVGVRYHRVREHENSGGGLFLMLSENGKYVVSGKGDKPIIDITGSIVTELFTGTHVNVEFKQGLIEITNDTH